MKLTRVILRGFTVFADAAFDLAPGINVLIGENGTGKSHLLKLVYALTEATRRFVAGESSSNRRDPKLAKLVREMLEGVFQPDSLGSFSSTLGGQASVSLSWTDARTNEEAKLEVTIGPSDDDLTAEGEGQLSKVGRAIFLPPREVLSMFPGFAAAWLNRESAFDRTYYDLCVALGLRPLRAGPSAALLEPLERALHGKVIVKGDRFYIEYGGGEMEVPMIGEGDRKVAMIAYLVMNGSLSENAYLLWDEPEANLNPSRARLMSETTVGLAHSGVQALLATHDYALTSELSLQVDTGKLVPGEAAFFSLRREEGGPSVLVERGLRLADLSHNAILDALAGLHRREDEAIVEVESAERAAIARGDSKT